MKIGILSCLAIGAALVSANARSAPGEYWEVTSKMDMPGMAMPARTSKICIPQGGEKDPKQMQGKDHNCQMSDIRSSGNKTSWKVKCVNEGETMLGEGEASHERDAYSSRMHMSGKSGGRAFDMTTISSGKKLGGSCDTGEAVSKMCDDVGKHGGLLNSSSMILPAKAPCAGKKEALCQSAREQLADGNVDVVFAAYRAIVASDNARDGSISKACGVNIEEAKKTACASHKADKSILRVANYCPTEAKAFKERERAGAQKKNCEGRGYTSRNQVNKCLAGKDGGDSAEETVAMESPRAKTKKAKADENPDAETRKAEGTAPAPSGNPSVNDVLDTANKLKGLLRF